MILAIDARTGGPRSYEHGIIDIGLAVTEDGVMLDSFHAWVQPDANNGYRPGYLKEANVSIAELEATGVPVEEALQGAQEFSLRYSTQTACFAMKAATVEGFLAPIQRRQPEHLPRLEYADLETVYAALRALGARVPKLRDAEAIMKWSGVDVVGIRQKPAHMRAALVGIATENVLRSLKTASSEALPERAGGEA